MLHIFRLHIGIGLLFLLMINVLYAQIRHESIFLSAFNKALQSKDTTGLSPFLSSSFSIAGHTGNGANFRLNQIVKSYDAKSLRLLAHKKVAKGVIYSVEFSDNEGSITPSNILIDTEGKLLYVTQFDQLYGLKRETESNLVAKIPFENRNGSIILQVHINDYEHPLNLLFDTGADGMAVSQELADRIGLKVTRKNNASVVGGNKVIEVSDNNKIRLDTVILAQMGIAIFPDMDRKHSDGIIGNSLIRRYVTHIDYDQNILSLYTFGSHVYPKKGHLVEVGMPSGVVLLPGDLEIVQGKKYRGQFVFDTGASYDLICFRPFVRQNRLLVSGFKPEVHGSTVSMGISSPTFMGSSYQFSIPPLPAMSGLPVTLMGGSADNEQWDPGADGSIGVRLLSRYNMTINLAESEVFFSPNKLHSLPQDFVIKGYQFGWDNQGGLRVLGTTGRDPINADLRTGDLIISFDDISSQQIKSKTSLINEIKGKSDRTILVKLSDDTIVSL